MLLCLLLNWRTPLTMPELISYYGESPDKRLFRTPIVSSKLETDYQSGAISLDEYYLYLAWMVFNPTKLPTRYVLPLKEVQFERKSPTQLILKIRENWESLSLETQNKIEFVFARPTDPGGDWPDYTQHLLPQLYNTTHFIMHWTNGTDGGNVTDAVPLNDTDTSGYPDYVEDFANIFENVWNFEINNRGFHAPPSDEEKPNDSNKSNPDGRYDVFIFDLTGPGYKYYGYANPEGRVNGSSYYSYIGVENDYQGFSTQGLDAMQVTAAHEFFHAIQFYYDTYEEDWWMETTATYMEDEVYPDVNDNYRYLPNWFLWPDRGLENTTGLHEYGTFIFAKRLSEDFGDPIIKEIWEKMSEPDMDGLVAINATLVSKNSTLTKEFSAFITANFFLEDYYVDGADYRKALNATPFNGVWLEYQYDASTAQNRTEINATNVNWDAWMDKWATDYITLKLDPGKPKYRIFFDGLDNTTNYLVKLVTKKGGTISERIFQLDEQKDGYLDLFYDAFENVTLIMANAGNTTTSNPSWRIVITFSQTFQTTLRILPSSVYESPYTNFTININVVDVLDLWSLEFKLYWNKTLLTCADATPLLLWSSTSVVHNEINETKGYYWLAMEGIEPSASFNGNATLATMTFYGIEIGECKLELSNTLLVETTGKSIPHQVEEGYFKALPHDVAIINITISKTVVERGSPLMINVTVENQGNFTENFNVTLYANMTVIGVQEAFLNPGESVVLSFNWDTSGYSVGDYLINAIAAQVPKEIDTEDNNFTDGMVRVFTSSDDGGRGSRGFNLKVPLLT